MKIFLVRHGETEWNRINRFQGISDIPLNTKGKAQVEALAQALKDETIDVVYSSPLIRARETAKAIRHFHLSSLYFEEEGLKEMDLVAYVRYAIVYLGLEDLNAIRGEIDLLLES